jgi:hypothetical protein
MLKEDIFIYNSDKKSFSFFSLIDKRINKNIAFDKGFELISIEDNIIYFFDDSGIGYRIGIDKGIVEFLASDNKINFTGSNYRNFYAIQSSNSIFDPYQGGIFDALLNKLLWKRNSVQISYIYKRFCLDSNNFKIATYSTLNGDILWQFDLSSLHPYIDENGDKHPAEVVSIIGVFEEKLWVFIKGNRFLCLDAAEGTLIKELDLTESIGLYSDIVSRSSLSSTYGAGIHLDADKGVIKMLANRYYLEVDLMAMQSEIKTDFGIKSNAWRINRCRFYEGDKNLYFIGKRDTKFDCAVGIFDTEKCAVVWSDEPLEKENYLFFADVPQRNDTHLAVVDTANNLWVYEKEDMINM